MLRRLGYTARITPIVRATLPVKRVNFVRFASSQSELDQRLQEITDAIESNPKLKEGIKELRDLFISKGMKPGEKPNMFKVSMLLMDKNVSQTLNTVFTELQNSNVKCTPEDLKSLLKLYNQTK